MKKFKFLKTLLVSLPVVTSMPTVLSSCTIQDYLGSIDGVTWKGWTGGRFQSTDYVVDLDAQTITYTNGTKFRARDLVIPEYVVYHFIKLKVILGKGCFLDNIHLVNSVTLNSFTDVIPERCFENCTSLSTVIFKRSPKRIEKRAFKGCLLIETFSVMIDGVVHENWAIDLEYIGDFAFSGCIMDFYYLVLGPNLKYLGRSAFNSCFGIGEINMQLCTQLTSINEATFFYCFSLKKIYLPNSITEIGDKAFAECSSLQQIYIPDPAKDKKTMNISLGVSAFQGCEDFLGFDHRCNFTSIGTSCFQYATSLTFFPWDYVAEDKSIIISPKAFYSCAFDRITFTPKVEDVGMWAFAHSTATVLDFTQTPYNEVVSKWTGSLMFDSIAPIGTILLPLEDKPLESIWISFFDTQGLKVNEPDESSSWNIRYK